jgi:hypothetical protein
MRPAIRGLLPPEDFAVLWDYFAEQQSYQTIGHKRAVSREAIRQWIEKSSGPGEFHPQALTDPDVSVSTHPAPTVQPLPDTAMANVQKGLVPDA